MFKKYFSVSLLNLSAAFILSAIAVTSVVTSASAEEIVITPKVVISEITNGDITVLAQATETAAEKAARKREERRLERQRKRAERAAKRKKRPARPRFGSFS